MNKRLLTYFYIVVGFGLLVATPAWADFQAGLYAYVRGDYDTALKEFRPLADQGHADAQFALGFMYYQGKGLPQDYHKAVKWCRLAADQGLAEAQAFLGGMYYFGQGVPNDYVLAHMWANLAAAKGVNESVKMRDNLERLMTPQQIAEAQRLAREWKAKGK